jgi:hypothetical protein
MQLRKHFPLYNSMHMVSPCTESAPAMKFTPRATQKMLHTIKQLAHTSNSSCTASNYANDLGVKMYNQRFIQTMEILCSYQNSKTYRHNHKPFNPLLQKKPCWRLVHTAYPTFCAIFLYLANLGITHAQRKHHQHSDGHCRVVIKTFSTASHLVIWGLYIMQC